MGFLDDMLRMNNQMQQMKMEAQLQDYSNRLDAITEQMNSLTGGVNEMFDLVKQMTEGDVEYFAEFKFYEAIDELNSKYTHFWSQLEPVRERHKANGDWDLLKNALDTRLTPLAMEYVTSAGKLAANAPNVAAFSSIWPVVLSGFEDAKKNLDFDYSEFEEIDFDPQILYNLGDAISANYNNLLDMGKELIEEWTPFGDYEDQGWRAEFDAELDEFRENAKSIEKYSNHARSLFRSLWEIKKQVELSQGAVAANTPDDPIAKIEKLAGLLEKGLISQEEFDEKKKKLLEDF